MSDVLDVNAVQTYLSRRHAVSGGERVAIYRSRAMAGSVALVVSVLLHGALVVASSATRAPLKAGRFADGPQFGVLVVNIETAPFVASELPAVRCPLPESPVATVEARPPAPPTRHAQAAVPVVRSTPPPGSSAPGAASSTPAGPVGDRPGATGSPAVLESEIAGTSDGISTGASTGVVGGGAVGQVGAPFGGTVVQRTVDDEAFRAAMDGYGREVHARVAAAVRFPERAAREGRGGVVMLRITLENDGRLRDVAMVGSDNDAVLGEAALDAVHRAAPFPRPPAEVAAPGKLLTFRLPIRFRLRDR